MDSEKLILLVRERRSLWDHKETNYHVRGVQRKLWEEVSSEINEPVEALKKRWRGLRDTFRREYKKEMNESQRSSWPFYNQLYFLSGTIHLKKTECSAHEMGEEEESQSQSDSTYEAQCKSTALATTWSQGEDLPHSLQLSTSTAKKPFRDPLEEKRKCSWDECSHCGETSLQLESETAKYIQERRKQDKYGDEQFLNSLLPFLNDIPKNRKLFVRTKIMKVLMEDSNRQECSSHHLSHISTSSNAPSTPRSTILPDIHGNSAD